MQAGHLWGIPALFSLRSPAESEPTEFSEDTGLHSKSGLPPTFVCPSQTVGSSLLLDEDDRCCLACFPSRFSPRRDRCPPLEPLHSFHWPRLLRVESLVETCKGLSGIPTPPSLRRPLSPAGTHPKNKTRASRSLGSESVRSALSHFTFFRIGLDCCVASKTGTEGGTGRKAETSNPVGGRLESYWAGYADAVVRFLFPVVSAGVCWF